MALSRSARRLAASPERVWTLVTDWPAHGRWIPFTTVTVDPDGPATGLGTRFTGRTALGRAGFDDPMTVTEWQPPGPGTPGRCRIVKCGRWLAGGAVIEVRPDGAGTLLSWQEEVRPRWTPKLADPVVAWTGRLLFDRVLRRLAAELG